MKYLLTLAALTLIGCGDEGQTFPTIPQGRYIDSEFTSYYQTFEDEATSRYQPELVGLDIAIQPTESLNGAYAKCVSRHTAHIVIAMDKWEKLNNVAREAVIFHAVGTCLLGIPNVPQVGSLMYGNLSKLLPIYTEHRDELIEEFFGLSFKYQANR